MKFITIILFLLTTLSCNSQNAKEIDITGNWYNYLNTSSEYLYYVETFINENTFFYYNEAVGLMPTMKYEISNDTLFLVTIDDNKKLEAAQIKFIDKNTFSFNNNGKKITFKRIVEGLNLEDYLFKNKSESDYRKFFNQRRAIWEKTRNKE